MVAITAPSSRFNFVEEILTQDRITIISQYNHILLKLLLSQEPFVSQFTTSHQCFKLNPLTLSKLPQNISIDLKPIDVESNCSVALRWNNEVKSPGISCVRFISAQAAETTPVQARQSAAVKLAITSPGFLGDPYSPSEPIAFWRRCFTRAGWKRTKEDIMAQLKSLYAISKVRKKYGYSKQNFYEEAVHLYQEINTLMANGDKRSLRKYVTENMYSALKNELKHRETVWVHVHWELIMPIVKIRTLRARLIGTDKNNIMKSFVQVTLEFLSRQRFEAYDSNGAVVAGDKNKEVLVRDIWVFERSLFHHGSYWRLCGRIKV